MPLKRLLAKWTENRVAFVPGKYFSTEKGKGEATMRLNYRRKNVRV